jgi:carbon monoxide dehydrogenase subunit G
VRQLRLEGEYVIRAPRDRVYAIITDFENTPKHFPAVAKSAHLVQRDGNNLVVDVETKAFFGSKTFKVRMEATLRPGEGFTSVNTSSLGVERESLTLETIAEGTRIVYINDVQIKSRVFRILGGLLLKRIALKYWERAVFGTLRQMLE